MGASLRSKIRARAIALAVAATVSCFSGASAAELRSVRVEAANFRDGPSPERPVLFVADRHYPVEVVASKRGWVKIRDFEGEQAWVASWVLDRTRTVVITVEHANLRAAAASEAAVVHRAERGAAFKVVARKGPWVDVVHDDGERGWVHESVVWGLEPSAAKGAAASPSPRRPDPPKATRPSPLP